jgi:predicted O-methyltransferase YrrM
MAAMLADLQERVEPHIVEFGCGQSTVVFASWVSQHGGRVTSYEHDPLYADTIRKQLAACGLTAHVDLRVVDLIEHPAAGSLPASRSYALPGDDDGIDLALVDGPPSWAGETGRYYPLRWSTDRLNPGGAAYLDDAARGPERRIVQALCAELPGIEAAEVRAEKGLVRISRQAAC